MPESTEKTSPTPELTEVTQANVLAEAAAAIAAEAAAKAAAAKAKAAEAAARAAALKSGTAEAPVATAAPESKPVAAPAPAPVQAPVAQSKPAAPAATPAPPQPEPQAAEPEVIERRSGTERRAEDERRATTDRRTGAPDTRPEGERTDRRSPEGRRTTPNPGRRATDLTDNADIIRLGDAVRAASSARAADRRSITRGPARAAGAVLEPVAHSAGLGIASRKKRRTFSPGLFVLIGLMIFFGMYATGNLPQFDRWTDAAVQKSQAHNDQVVGAISSNWHMLAYGAVGICILLIVLLFVNSMRARANEDAE